MQPRGALAAGLCFAAGLALTVARLASAQPAPAADPQTVAAGKYLVAAGDCVACHTADGGTPFAGGTVIRTGFGKMLGPNITPDPQTGIGGWSDDEFVAALKYGRGHDGIHLYPGMPYIYFNNVPRAEILKIKAYLDTLAPVHNEIVSNQLAFPFNIRLLMIGWNMLFFPNHGDYKPNAGQSAEWNRGAYLAQGLGHCAACHTAKNILGGDRTGQEFEGAIVDGMNAPALVNDPHNGLGVWSVDDIATYLKTGHNRFADAAGDMASVVTHSTSQLTDADDQAIGTYIHALPSNNAAAPAPIAANDPAMVAGGHIYAQACSACHTGAGAGLARIIPSLQGSPVVVADDPVTIIRVVQHGGQSVGTPGGGAAAMPAFAGILTAQETADVLTYIRNSWGNAAAAVSVDKVSSVASVP